MKQTFKQFMNEIEVKNDEPQVGWFIVCTDTMEAGSHDYETYQEAVRASKGFKWYNSDKYTFMFGYVNEDDIFVEQDEKDFK